MSRARLLPRARGKPKTKGRLLGQCRQMRHPVADIGKYAAAHQPDAPGGWVDLFGEIVHLSSLTL